MKTRNHSGRGMKTTGSSAIVAAARAACVAVCALVFISSSAFAQTAGQTNSPAKQELFCVVCGKGPLTGTVWSHRRGHVCSDCYKLETRCAICSLPVKDGFIKTPDGRIICKFDAATAVLKQEDARRVFDDTVRELAKNFGPMLALRFTNITVTLMDVDYWNQRDGKRLPATSRQNGFSKTLRTGRDMTHSVLLLSGVPRAEMSSVCAHEYTHLWLNENLAETRLIEPDTTEAICELVAYKLASAHQDTAEQERIQKNRYTAGRIDALIALETKHGLPAVLEWARKGTSETPDAAALASFDSGSQPAVAGALFQPVGTARPRPV
ncbi:MAG: protein DA1, partial [Verrucomicrobia bacterium]|nr:protein DA1 [Verrucomicrobiota bacterium]